MIDKYHINSEGEPGICKATKIACRFGDKDTEHYNSVKEAQVAYELKNAQIIFERTVTKSPEKLHKRINVTVLNKEMNALEIESIIKNTPRKNIFLGKVNQNKKLSKEDFLEMQMIANELENLRNCSELDSTGSFINPENISEDVGFRFLGEGGFRTAFLEIETNKVYKIPHLDNVNDKTQPGYSQVASTKEQKSYALLDNSFFDKTQEVQYLETLFITAENGTPIIIQDYCEGRLGTTEEIKKIFTKIKYDLNKVDGLWDVYRENFKLNEKNQIIMFDCLNPYTEW